jgi:hypothetical protein
VCYRQNCPISPCLSLTVRQPVLSSFPDSTMMVPRSFLHASASPGRPRYLDEKKPGSPRPREHVSLHYMPPRSTPEPAQKSQAVPVKIPERKKVQAVLRPNRAQQDVRSVPTISLPAEEPMQIQRAGSGAQRIDSLLAATTIPLRKKPRPRPSQRLPNGNHVADFSKLLLDDVMSTGDGSLTGSLSNPQFDGLFGEFHEPNGQSRGGIEGVPGSLISLRSLSSESIPSLDNDSVEASFNDITSPLSPSSRSTSERRLRQLSSSVDCAEDHPLLHFDHLDLDEPPLPEIVPATPSPELATRSPTLKSRTSTFRSNLTASLRAIKSAAQTMSSIAANPVIPPDDFLTRSVFSFAPELTDDKRPPPSDDNPSPALRRYLNPPPKPLDSPSELHFWHDHPSSTRLPATKTRDEKALNKPVPSTPPAIPLQTCIPSAVRSPTASSPPIWLSADGTPTTRSPTDGLSAGSTIARQREPRENSDWLRILVLEMNMRRSGKFSEEAEGHARMALPPRKVDDKCAPTGRNRWIDYCGPCGE